ncbi:hypothetical protein [Bacillus pumilus]|uniref:hypothetical protein n=1 Tax=Bacillus pumilus TaxID=1408 RepID=UPI0011A7D525|nr:hypothetical protein [Bacillus pumilus]
MDYKEMFEVKEEIRKSIEEAAKKAAEKVFASIDKETFESAVITGYIARRVFQDAFDFKYETLLMVTDEIKPAYVVSGKE